MPNDRDLISINKSCCRNIADRKQSIQFNIFSEFGVINSQLSVPMDLSVYLSLVTNSKIDHSFEKYIIILVTFQITQK